MDKNQILDSKNQIPDRTFADRSETFRIRLRGKEYGGPGRGLSLLVRDRTMPNDLELIHGKYWESAHWSHEHILFLELKAPLPWREEFKRLNHLIEVKPDGGLPSGNAPKWFRPPKYYKVLISNTEHGQVPFIMKTKKPVIYFSTTFNFKNKNLDFPAPAIGTTRNAAACGRSEA
ncbi:hypothetical protein LEP1GSC036_4092 [Leptospira weilii str. 2006001853]|uniref:Uncharacterized protein n=1 Tax=Leptospira weilii str. 2006001853 TaxID=1001589 RepID=A0A828Z5J6_9LEPT|nr:hypothetical protein LEP1GSC036_4092 [Leptospira weilii str. 2006001853]